MEGRSSFQEEKRSIHFQKDKCCGSPAQAGRFSAGLSGYPPPGFPATGQIPVSEPVTGELCSSIHALRVFCHIAHGEPSLRGDCLSLLCWSPSLLLWLQLRGAPTSHGNRDVSHLPPTPAHTHVLGCSPSARTKEDAFLGKPLFMHRCC